MRKKYLLVVLLLLIVNLTSCSNKEGIIDAIKYNLGDINYKIRSIEEARFEMFGSSLAMNDDLIIIGASGDSSKGDFSGSVYVYKIDDDEYTRKISPADGVNFGVFGSTVATVNNYIIVGAPGDDDYGNSSGSVYVYKIDDEAYKRKITASDGSARALFGRSLASNDDYIVVGAPTTSNDGIPSGSVYLYKYDDDTYERKLTASDGSEYDKFGASVAIYGNYIAVGAWSDDDNGNRSGSVYVYKLDDDTYERKIIMSDGFFRDKFGFSLSLYDDYLVVGAPGDDDTGEDSGSVMVYNLDDETYERKIIASDGQKFEYFGEKVIVDDEHIFVVARSDETYIMSGSVYIFKLDDETYERKITSSEDNGKDNFDVFGSSVASSGDHIVVGAGRDGENDSESGAVYVYDFVEGYQIDINIDEYENIDALRDGLSYEIPHEMFFTEPGSYKIAVTDNQGESHEYSFIIE
ncbi:FG-GAP repeat protein [Mycoplasmatota bacterium zrk1]